MNIQEATDLIKKDKVDRESSCLASIIDVLNKHNCELIVGRYDATRDGRLIPQIAVESK